MLYMWMKILHLFFVISWFTGLFYLPRIFVNLAMVPTGSQAEYDRLIGMATRLKKFMIILMAGTWIFGIILLVLTPSWLHMGWMHAKLLLVVLLSGYDGYCSKLLRGFKTNSNTKSHKWYRWFNEAPTIVLFLIIVLVLLKPF